VIIKVGEKGPLRERELPEAIRNVAEQYGLLDTDVGAVLSTRQQAKALLWDNRSVDPTKQVFLDCTDVEIATASFFDELLKAWPHARISGASEDVALTFRIVIDHRGRPDA